MNYAATLVRLLGSIPANTGAMLLMTLACYGAGRLVLRRLCPQWKRPELLTSLTLGGVLWAFAGFVSGNLLPAAPVWSVAILPAVLAVCGIMEFYKCGSCLTELRSRWEISVVVLLLGGWFFASAELLPYSWDEQTYQIAVPAMWLQNGSVMPSADLPYSAFPMMPQFLLLWLFKLGGIGTARLLILGAFLLLFYGLYGELRACSGRLIAGGLTLLLILSPLAGAMIREFYAEVFLALLMLSAMRVCRQWGGMTLRHAVLLGLLAGGAAAVKLTGLGVSLAILAMVLLHRPDRKVFLLFAGSAAIFVVFYFRSWIALGNPFYPFGSAFFGVPSGVVERYHSAMGETHYGPGKWTGGVLGWLFSGYDGVIYDGIILGWAFPLLFAGCAAGCYLAWRKKLLTPGMIKPGLALTVLYLFWAVTSQQTRFMLPMVPVLLLLTAHLFSLLSRRGTIAGLAVLLILGGWSVDVWAWKHGFYCWKFLPDARTAPVRLLSGATREKGLMKAYTYLAEKTPENAGVLLVFERRGLYCPRPHRNGSPGFQDWFDFTKYPDWIGELKKRNIHYLLVAASRKNPDVQEAFLAADQAFGEAVYQGLRTGRLHLLREASAEAFFLIKIM